MKREQIEEKYDEFFGTGYWEVQYKKHIVEFAFQCSNSGKPIVSGSLPSDERIFFADYIQRCVIDRGAMTYPSLKDAITAWDETKDRFGGNDR